jgi:hypothetical protein
MAENSLPTDEELVLSPERWTVVEPRLKAFLAGLRELERLESFDDEPLTNARRWWLDDDTE